MTILKELGKNTPHLADMKPGGEYVMNSLDKIGGIPFIMKKLADSNLTSYKCINCYRQNN